ncbi:MAG: HNH endonuclease signature motif containing protein, partial [Actinomycetota bacterium]
RSPGCTAPAEHTDLHHAYLPRAAGGGHDPDELIALCRRHHRQAERHGWRLALHPTSGQVTLERADRQWHTLPHGTGLPHPTHDHPPNPASAHHPADPGDPPSGHGDDTLPF